MSAPTPVLAQVPSGKGRRLHISWGTGDQLQLSPIAGAQGAAKGDLDNVQTTYAVKWSALAASERRVAYDSLPAFQALHTKRNAGSGAADPSDLQEYAESISRTLAPSIDRVGEEDVCGQPQEAAMWDLLRIFYLGPFTDGSFVEALAAWVQRHARVLTTASAPSGEAAGPSLPEQIEALHSSESAPEQQPQYWPLLQRLVALGMTEDAVGLLGLHSAWQLAYAGGRNQQMLSLISILEPAILLLRRMPRLHPPAPVDASVQAFDDLPVFLEHRHAWQLQVRQLLQDATLWSKAVAANKQTAEGVRELLDILLGADASLVSGSATWLEHLLAMCLHVYPGMRPNADLEPLLLKSLASKDGGGVELLIVLEDFFQAAAKQELQGVLEVCSHSFSAWFMAHVPDLLARHPTAPATLGRFLPHFGADQTEFYMLEYASALMTAPQTWELAVEYLAWCPVHGEAVLQRFLEQLPLVQESDDLALKALQVCRRYGMRAQERGICLTVGMQRLQQGRLATALQWLGRAGDEGALAAAARPLVQSIAEHAAAPSSHSGDLERTLGDLEAMSNAAASGSGSESGQGTFGLIRSYIAFVRGLGQGSNTHVEALEDIRAASAALLQLLKHPSLPAATHANLLFNSIELLEAPISPPLFSVADTQQLIGHLLEAASALRKGHGSVADVDTSGQEQQHFLEAKIDAVQLTLSRNLARAHIAAPLA